MLYVVALSVVEFHMFLVFTTVKLYVYDSGVGAYSAFEHDRLFEGLLTYWA